MNKQQDPSFNDDPFADLRDEQGDTVDSTQSMQQDITDVDELGAGEGAQPSKKSKLPLYLGMGGMAAVALFMVYTAVAPKIFPKKPANVEVREIQRAPQPDVVEAKVQEPVRVDAPQNMPLAATEKTNSEAVNPDKTPGFSSNTSAGAVKSAPISSNTGTISPQKLDAKMSPPATGVADDEVRLALISVRESIAAFDQRMKALEKKVEQGPPQVGAVIPSPVSTGSRSGVEAETSEIRKSTREARARRAVEQKERDEIAKAQSITVEPGSPIYGYRVIAIYPRTGDFKKAWITNGEKRDVVVVGDVFNGVSVTRIDGAAMSVQTTAGAIRMKN